MRAICRAVESRRNYLADLKREIPYLEIVWDQHRDPMETFLRAMELAGDDPAIHLEDDALLCERFMFRALGEIAEHPKRVIQFFSMYADDAVLGSREHDRFVSAVCFYMPAGHSKGLLDYAPRWPKRTSNPTAVDIMLRHWLQKERNHEPHWIVVPNLAEHRIGPSSIDAARPERRQSMTFRYFDGFVE